jgi:hypothetical protein
MPAGRLLIAPLLLLLVPALLAGQGRRGTNREVLAGYVGQEVLLVDTTSGEKQFLHDDANVAYRVRLVAVMEDHLVVMREAEGDRRAFIYPLSLVRRLVTMTEGKSLRPIVIEMY